MDKGSVPSQLICINLYLFCLYQTFNQRKSLLPSCYVGGFEELLVWYLNNTNKHFPILILTHI